MSATTATLAGRRAAERLMTDNWTVYRVTGQAFNSTTGQYADTVTTVYDGPGKLQSFESYEQTPEAAAHTFVVMRPHLHLPIGGTTDDIEPDDYAVCTASPMDAGIVGTVVRIAGLVHKTFATARRFPVSEIQA